MYYSVFEKNNNNNENSTNMVPKIVSFIKHACTKRVNNFSGTVYLSTSYYLLKPEFKSKVIRPNYSVLPEKIITF